MQSRRHLRLAAAEGKDRSSWLCSSPANCWHEWVGDGQRELASEVRGVTNAVLCGILQPYGGWKARLLTSKTAWLVHPCRCNGRLEILHTNKGKQGEWGTVCKYGFGFREASVICGQLARGPHKCGTTGEYVDAGKFGRPPAMKVWLTNVRCDGDEACLDDCHHNPWGAGNCKSVVGVICT